MEFVETENKSKQLRWTQSISWHSWKWKTESNQLILCRSKKYYLRFTRKLSFWGTEIKKLFLPDRTNLPAISTQKISRQNPSNDCAQNCAKRGQEKRNYCLLCCCGKPECKITLIWIICISHQFENHLISSTIYTRRNYEPTVHLPHFAFRTVTF